MNSLKQALDDFKIDENITFFVTKFYQKFFFSSEIFEHVEISLKFSKLLKDFYRRDILKIIHDLFETINFTHIIIETQKRFVIILNQMNIIASKMKNLNVIKKKLTIIKNFINILIDFFNNIFIRLNNKRNNFDEFIFKLKNTRVSKILSSNAFKSYQNFIVFLFFSIFSLFKLRETIFKLKFFIKFFINSFKCKKYKKQNCYLKSLHIKTTLAFRLFSRTTI